MFIGLSDLSAAHGGGLNISGSFRISEYSLHLWLLVFLLIELFVSCELSLLSGIEDYKHWISAMTMAKNTKRGTVKVCSRGWIQTQRHRQS